MHYQINVSLKGRRFFATAEHSCTTRVDAALVYRELVLRFPREDGYEITVTKWEHTERDATNDVEELITKTGELSHVCLNRLRGRAWKRWASDNGQRAEVQVQPSSSVHGS